MEWLWVALGIVAGLALLPFAALLCLHVYILIYYMKVLVRIFQEKPLFIIPRGQPVADAEEVTVPTPDGLALRGIYRRAEGPRKGVLLFGLEYGSNRWAAVPYTDFLRSAGYDIFTFEMRGQGDSPAQPGYEPLQWVTEFEVTDFRAALDYLKARPDADPRGIGFFGLSKGGGAGVIAAAADPFVRCFVTDGIFATHGTMVPYIRQWIKIYVRFPLTTWLLPTWYYHILARAGIRRSEKQRNCHYPRLKKRLPLLAPRPLFMIHGAADTYIKPDMAQELFGLAREPKALWLVEGAKHNQCFHVAHEEYKARVREFFDKHLAALPAASSTGTLNGKHGAPSNPAPRASDR